MIQKITYWFYSLVDTHAHRKYGGRKSKLIDAHPEVIVEVGAGYGANFRYLKPGTKVIAIEPKEALHPILKERASRYEIELEVYNCRAEEMPFPDNFVEMVLSSLVLCSVDYPDKALAEIKRILKPEGRFIYLEHVKAQNQPIISFFQKIVKASWKCLFDGCHVDRETGRTIQNAGFRKVNEEAFMNSTIIIPVRPHISGVAVK